MRVVGMISGTSVDAIDVAVADLSWDGRTVVLQRVGHQEVAWPPALRARLLAALPPAPVTLGELCALDVEVGEAFGAAAAEVIAGLAGGQADLVASHGQNVFHWISEGRARGTLQIGQPACIVERTGLPVVSDFRARDVAAGGQGAPLASTLDALWLARPDGRRRAALNLGGIANLTVVGAPGEAVLAFDTGPASCLLDLEAARLTNGAESCDRDGKLALSGGVRKDLLDAMLADSYFARPAPKSTGRELFDARYVARHLLGIEAVSGPDLMASLTALTARSIAAACHRHEVTQVVASGGGVRNPALMAALREALGDIPLVTSEVAGLPTDGKEAYLFALLGFLTWHGLPGTVRGATGSDVPRVLGRISPGNLPLRLPEPAMPPTGLRIVSPGLFLA